MKKFLICYIANYICRFPIPEEQEDPTIWKNLLRKKTNPILHILLIRIQNSQEIAGFLFAEFYKKSKCGLLTYLAIHPKYRCQGIGKYLLRKGVQKLKNDAKNI